MAADEQVLRTGFCKACLADSTDESPGGISRVNGIGRKFYGSAEKCPACGSVVRVLWFVFVEIPIVPLGAYRYQLAEGGGLSLRSRFVARRTHLRWQQVFAHWAVGLVLGAVAFALIAAYTGSKGKR